MKIAIIGSGVSGLCAGSYLQMNGFSTEIYEQHSSTGGLCTSWKNDGFTFESGFQWLLGSSPANPFYHLWAELIDMDSIHFVQHEVRMALETKIHRDNSGSNIFHLYTDLKRLENYLLDISPEDQKPISQLILTMRKIQAYEIPPAIKSNPDILPFYRKLKYVKYLPLLLFMNQIKKETNFTFAAKLKNPFLREAFELLFDGDEQPLMIITVPLAFNDLKATAYPVGGATKFVDKLKDRYLKLGGIIHLNSPVKSVTVKGNKATGLLLEDGRKIDSDITISTADWHFTIFKALGGRFVDRTIRELGDLKRLPLFYSIFMVSLGISKTFERVPHFYRFPMEDDLISPDGTCYSRMESHIYNYDPTLAPSGKTVISVSFITHKACYWIDLRKQNREEYLRQKREFASSIIKVLDRKLGGIIENIEVTDIATPATFHRYTRNRMGAAQGWMTGKDIMARTPITTKLPGLEQFYYSGHWSQPGGGLPVAVKSARDMVQVICKDLKRPFKAGS